MKKTLLIVSVPDFTISFHLRTMLLEPKQATYFLGHLRLIFLFSLLCSPEDWKGLQLTQENRQEKKKKKKAASTERMVRREERRGERGAKSTKSLGSGLVK